MMKFDYHCTFNLDDCIKQLGLEERGRVQQRVGDEVLRLSDDYVPFDIGTLKDSGRTKDGGKEVVWSTPYARYMWNGIVYVDPELNCAGFLTDDGWRSRKDIKKVPTDRKLEYQGGNLRGPRWVERMMQNGGREKIERVARKAVRE